MLTLNSFTGPIKNALIVLLLACIVAGGFYVKGVREDSERVRSIYEQQISLNDSTEAKLARSELARRELEASQQAAKELGGKVVAGVKIVVPAETLYVETKVAPTEEVNGTRYATLQDEQEGYRIRINAEAPPFPDSLRIGYELTTPEFNPEVGFVRTGKNQYIAVVTWAGKKVTIEDSFFAPQRAPLLELDAWARSPIEKAAVPVIGLSARTNINTWRLSVGYSSRKTVEVELSKKLWSIK